MNKKETLEKISEISQVNISDCEKVVDALERVLTEELETSKGISSAFDKVYKIMSFFKKNN
jgi:nucleoid DNA-binding protein